MNYESIDGFGERNEAWEASEGREQEGPTLGDRGGTARSLEAVVRTIVNCRS